MKKISSMLAVFLCVVAVVMCFAACKIQEAPKTFTVTMPNSPVGYVVKGEKTATDGKNYQFTVTIAEGYQKDENFAVKVNGAAVAEIDGKYVVANVNANIAITVEGVSKIPGVYTVTIPQNDGYTVNGAATATEGTNYEFTVTIAEGYQKGENFVVKVNGVAVTEADGKYVIANVNANIAITVEGVSKIVYSVTMPESPVGYTVNGAATATDGANYEFTVTIAAGYEKNENFAVKVNGAAVTEADGKYVVANVKANIAITVEGVSKILKIFNVTMPESPVGYTVSGATTATESKNYEFTINFADGYKAGEDFVVTVNGKPVTATEGKYVVENVSRNLVIEVEGVVEITLKATFTAENFDKALKNTTEEFAYSAAQFTFTIELADHYTQCAEAIEVYYTYDGGVETKLAANGEGIYAIVNPHKDIAIIVKNVAKNVYKVTFYRNAVQKYAIEEVVAESVLTDEQINAAKAAVVNNGETFVAWRQDITAAIVDNTVFSAYTTTNNLFGEIIEGCALVDGTEKTLAEGEYSAAGGYQKVYTKAAVTEKGFAAIDVSQYTEVRFAFSISNSWLLFEGWSYYVNNANVWYEVTMTNLLTGKWQVTIVGSVNHNMESGTAEVLTTAKFTLEGEKLSDILKSWYNDSQSGVTLNVTELRGKKAEKYGEVVAEVPTTGATLTTDKKVPVDFDKAYDLADPLGKTFAEVDISKYEKIKFYILVEDGYADCQGWGAYFQRSDLGGDWVPVTIVNNGGTNWTITIEGHLSGGNVTDITKFTYNASATTLKDLLTGWFSFSGSNPHVYLTEIRGIKKVIEIKGKVIEGGVLTANTTENTTMEAAEGFEKVYAVNGTFDQDIKSTADLSKYSEVMFAFKSEGYFLIDGWDIFLKEDYADWAYVTMFNKGDGTWSVTVFGNVWTGKIENPWTRVYTGNSIATILADWYNGSNIYLSELRGVLAPVTEESAAAPSAVWGEQVAASAAESTEATTETVPNGYETVTVFTKKSDKI